MSQIYLPINSKKIDSGPSLQLNWLVRTIHNTRKWSIIGFYTIAASKYLYQLVYDSRISWRTGRKYRKKQKQTKYKKLKTINNQIQRKREYIEKIYKITEIK